MASTAILLLAILISLFFHSKWAQPKVYIVHMDKTAMPKAFSSHQNWFHSTLSSVSESPEIPISSKLIHTYTNAMHGFSAILTPSEHEALKSLPGYLHSFPDRRMKLHTTHSQKFLGLNHNSGAWPTSSYGKDVVIGVIDTGVWPESPSFSDKGMTKIPSRWKGKCELGERFNSSLCNKKLIGARFFNKAIIASEPNITIVNNSPRDDEGHGTHTASTAGGNFVEGASYFGYAAGTASGVAPRARVAIYKALWEDSAAVADCIDAVDKAIEDGVDILSLSIGLPREDYVLYQDGMSIATFAAMERGIFLSASAGNDGPRTATVENGAPWITTVAAGTVDRKLLAELILGNGVRFSFDNLFPGKPPNPKVGLVFLNDSCDDVKKISKFRKKIVVCQGDQTINLHLKNAEDAKVYGAVFITKFTMFSGIMIAKSYPKLMLSPKEGQTLINYIKTSKNPTGRFDFRRTTLLGTKPAPKVASYSSRGPYLSSPSLLKPDITAPGSLILAAWPPTTQTAKLLSGRQLFSDFNVISGTSMAAPHVSGIAALVKSIHPDWSPAAIRSAIITTADPLDNTGHPIQDEAAELATVMAGYHNAPGLDCGAGHVVPNKAIDPGLIYDITPEDYITFLCGLNYTAKQIQVITKSKPKCAKRSLDINYPSFLAYFNGVNSGNTGHGRTDKVVWEFRRTVTNVGKERSSYTAKLTAVSELKVKIEPTKLVFKKKHEKLSYKLTLEGPKVLKAKSILGSLSWVEDSGKYVVRSPIVATSFNPKDFENKSM